MQPLQDWCLQCGAGAPGSLGGGPRWRTGAAVLGMTAALVAGASVAAYAALNKNKPALTPVAAHTPATTTPPVGTPVTPGTTTTPGGVTSTLTPPPPTTAPGTPTTLKSTPPKIPLQTPTPKASESEVNEANNPLFPPGEPTKTTSTTPANATKPSGSTKSGSSSPTGEGQNGEGEAGEIEPTGSGSEPPSPILLDTNAASTYNPYAQPANAFGDPSLAIDGEASTAWSAQVDPANAPHMAEGLVLDLRTAQKLGSVVVKTKTTGMTVELYGANGHNLPASITDKGWKRLSRAKVLKKSSTTVKLKGSPSYRFVLLWVTKAPAGSTQASPGHIAISEFELLPPS